MDPRVQLGHMDCIVQESSTDPGSTSQNENNEKTNNSEEEVTFLYRLCGGSSPRSYGINVARLARLPSEVIALAMKQSKEFEERMRCGEEAVLHQLQVQVCVCDYRNILTLIRLILY